MKEDFFVDETEIVKVLEKIEQCDNSSFARYISDEGLNLCDEAVLRNAFFNYSISAYGRRNDGEITSIATELGVSVRDIIQSSALLISKGFGRMKKYGSYKN